MCLRDSLFELERHPDKLINLREERVYLTRLLVSDASVHHVSLIGETASLTIRLGRQREMIRAFGFCPQLLVAEVIVTIVAIAVW